MGNVLHELSITITVTPTIYCDNIGATHLAANPVFHSRMKHLGLDFYCMREKVQAGSLRVTHVANDDQVADVLTKPLAHPRIHMLLNKIGLTPRSSVLRGDVNDKS